MPLLNTRKLLEEVLAQPDLTRPTKAGRCPKCGSRVWDNRQKQGNWPIWKCRNAECNWRVWPRHPQMNYGNKPAARGGRTN